MRQKGSKVSSMGAGASALPAVVDKQTARTFAGDKFDENAFDEAAGTAGTMAREEFLRAAGLGSHTVSEGAAKGKSGKAAIAKKVTPAPTAGKTSLTPASGKASTSGAASKTAKSTASSKAGSRTPKKLASAAGGGKQTSSGGKGGMVASSKEAAASEAVAEVTKTAEQLAAEQLEAEKAAAQKVAAEQAAAEKAASEKAAAEAEKARRNGRVKIHYNHYDKEYDIVDGKLDWEHVDDQYAISFVFKGQWTCNLKCKATEERILPDGGALHVEMRKDPDGFDPDDEEEKWCGFFSGLCVLDDEGKPNEYVLEVQEDAVWDAAARAAGTYKTYKAPAPEESCVSQNSKQESCSCIEGNPCADAYCCKDWKNRFEVAKKHGWKGFS